MIRRRAAVGGCSEEVVERGVKQGRTKRRSKQENIADEDIKNNEHHPSFISPLGPLAQSAAHYSWESQIATF
jgi:hypothetical protein